MNLSALYHRTAIKLCLAIEQDTIRQIHNVPSDISDYEFNRRLNRLDEKARAWSEMRHRHEAALRLVAA